MTVTKRDKYLGLIDAISNVLEGWPDDTEDVGAIETLEALGYAVGLIFSAAPNIASREYARLHFLHSVEAGLAKRPDNASLN